jgi:hypothetical protein
LPLTTPEVQQLSVAASGNGALQPADARRSLHARLDEGPGRAFAVAPLALVPAGGRAAYTDVVVVGADPIDVWLYPPLRHARGAVRTGDRTRNARVITKGLLA